MVAQEDADADDSISSSRPLNFKPSQNRLTGTRFRNTYKGTAGQDDEVRTVLKPATRTYSFANRKNRNKAETTSGDKENEVEFEPVTDRFDDEQYVDDNYEGVTNSADADTSSATTRASTTKNKKKKVANVPVDAVQKAKRPLFSLNNRKPPSTLRQSNVPHSVALNTTTTPDTSSSPSPSPALGATNTTHKDTATDDDDDDAIESTTPLETHSEDTETQTQEADTDAEEGSTDETNAAVNLQEYYARGGNGTPTPGPLSSLLNRKFKPNKNPTTTTKPTTLHHVFAIDVEKEKDSKSGEPKNGSDASSEQVSKKLRKLVEVNRIVEVNSKQQKVSPSESSDELGQVVESRPMLDRIGEISRLAVVNLKKAQREGRGILTPDMIFGVETSTISLEGLFEKDRQAKELVVKEEKDEHNNTINVVYARTITQQDYPEYAQTSPLPTTTTTTTETPTVTTSKYNNVVRPLVPMLRPETIGDGEAPYVITLASLDQVILTKVGVVGPQTTTEEVVAAVAAEESATGSTTEEEVGQTTVGSAN